MDSGVSIVEHTSNTAEKKNRSLETSSSVEFKHIPSVDSFPRKSREHVAEIFAQAHEKVNKITKKLGKIEELDSLLKTLFHEYDPKVTSVHVKETTKIDIGNFITQIDSIFQDLRWSQQEIDKNREAYDFIKSAESKLYSEEQRSYLYDNLERGHAKFGKTVNPIRMIEQKIKSRDKRYRDSKEKYQNDQTNSLGRVTNDFVDMVRLQIQEKIPSVTFSNNFQEEITQQIEESDKVSRDSVPSIKKRFEDLKGQRVQLIEAKAYLASIEEWMEPNESSLQNLRSNFGVDAASDLRKQLQFQKENIEKTEASLQANYDRIFAQSERMLSDAFVEIEDTISFLATSWPAQKETGWESMYLNDAWMPQEFSDLLTQLEEKFSWITAFTDNLDPKRDSMAKSIQLRSDELQKRLKFLRERLLTTQERNESFPSSQETLWHTGDFDTIANKILKSGYLASRKFQLESLGEASFNTAGISSMTKDKVVINQRGVDVELSWDEYEKWSAAQGIKKNIQQEGHQVCFSEESADVRFKDGIALVFPKNELLSGKQFMYADGIHIFDQAFKTGREDSAGYSIDLTSQNFVCVVEKNKRDAFLQSVDQMFKTEKWSKTTTIQNWLASHVVFIDKIGSQEDVNKKVNEKLDRLGRKKIDVGSFIPTGNRGETATREQHPLYSYLGNQELAAQIQRESTSFPTKEFESIVQKESLDDVGVQEAIKVLREDYQLDEVFPMGVGVMERYTLETHTRMSLNIFETFFSSKLPDETKKFMRTFLLLHDVGKPIAIEKKGSNSYQHEYTEPIMKRVFSQLESNHETIELATEILHNNSIGDYLTGAISAEIAGVNIRTSAEKLNLPAKVFFDLLQISYISDAGSYTLQAGKNLDGVVAKQSLDFLFTFDENNHSATFSSEPSFRFPFNDRSPQQLMENLRVRVY